MITRRGFLGLASSLAASFFLGCSQKESQTAVHTPTSTPSTPTPVPTPEKEFVHLPELPWEYKSLDPDHVAGIAYKSYQEGHCMYAVFNSVVQALGEKIGFPYTEFPTKVTVYGKGGVTGWSTLCGALNGAGMTAYLVLPEKDADEVINEVYSWYQHAELPEYTPSEAFKADLKPFPKSVSHSTLCHASVTNWCRETGYKAFSAERVERCGRLAADVAKKVVELINAKHAGTFTPAYPLDPEIKTCRGCHTKGSTLENTRGKLYCKYCHNVTQIEGHPKV